MRPTFSQSLLESRFIFGHLPSWISANACAVQWIRTLVFKIQQSDTWPMTRTILLFNFGEPRIDKNIFQIFPYFWIFWSKTVMPVSFCHTRGEMRVSVPFIIDVVQINIACRMFRSVLTSRGDVVRRLVTWKFILHKCLFIRISYMPARASRYCRKVCL